MQFDWLLACKSKYDIRNLSFMHNPTCRTQQDQKSDLFRFQIFIVLTTFTKITSDKKKM